jgi:hypothetical protein
MLVNLDNVHYVVGLNTIVVDVRCVFDRLHFPLVNGYGVA